MLITGAESGTLARQGATEHVWVDKLLEEYFCSASCRSFYRYRSVPADPTVEAVTADPFVGSELAIFIRSPIHDAKIDRQAPGQTEKLTGQIDRQGLQNCGGGIMPWSRAYGLACMTQPLFIRLPETDASSSLDIIVVFHTLSSGKSIAD